MAALLTSEYFVQQQVTLVVEQRSTVVAVDKYRFVEEHTLVSELKRLADHTLVAAAVLELERLVVRT